MKQKETAAIQKVQRGQRQYALFAGLNKEGSACGHVSENGASSFLNKYALHKCNSADQSPAVPADSPAEERTELREYRYTKVQVTLRDGKEVARDLVALPLNPWWYPHDLDTPANDGTGGPFTIGRVIHSSRSVGFTGWIGGVAVFNRALNEEELTRLSALSRQTPTTEAK